MKPKTTPATPPPLPRPLPDYIARHFAAQDAGVFSPFYREPRKSIA